MAMNSAGNHVRVGLGMVLVGAIAVAIAVFLPLVDSKGTYASVVENSLIQQQYGWVLIVLAILIATSGVQADQRQGRWWLGTAVWCVISGLMIAGWAADTGMRTLHPVGPSHLLDTSDPGVVVPFGIALYVAGAGVVTALIGATIMRQSQTMGCPDCAETILGAAKVCKHCGYRFNASELVKNRRRGTRVKVKCCHCQYVQPVPAEVSVFVCAECGAEIRRKPAPL